MTLAAEILADSPLAYWKHPGGSTTDADQSGNSRDLTWTAAPTASVIVESNGVTLAADKEGSIADATWMHQTTWTLEWWHRSSSTGSGLFSVVSRRVTIDRWAVYIRRATGDIQLLVFPGAVSAFSSATNLLDGNLHHCVVEVIFNGSNTSYAMFVDGEPAGSGPLISGSVSTGSEPWHSWGENGSRRFTGKVAHKAFYNTALSAARVAAHYNEISPLPSLGNGWSTGGVAFGGGGLVLLPVSSTWHYKQIGRTDATDYSAVAFDDSAWSTGPAPFGQTRIGGVTSYPYPSHFDLESRLWVRAHLTLASKIFGLVISGQVDNDLDVWWNGIRLGSVSLFAGGGWSFVVPRWAQLVGDNVIACRATDDADVADPDGAFFSAQVRKPGGGWHVG